MLLSFPHLTTAALCVLFFRLKSIPQIDSVGKFLKGITKTHVIASYIFLESIKLSL